LAPTESTLDFPPIEISSLSLSLFYSFSSSFFQSELRKADANEFDLSLTQGYQLVLVKLSLDISVFIKFPAVK